MPTERAGGRADAAAPGAHADDPRAPPGPGSVGGGDGGEGVISMPDASGRASSSSPVGSSSSSGASSSRASSSSPPESPELVAMRRTTFVTELVVSAAMLRLAFAVAVVDGWREPTLMCVGFAACVAFVAAHHGDDGWRASRRRSTWRRVVAFADRRGEGSPAAGRRRALLAPSARETYRGWTARRTPLSGSRRRVFAVRRRRRSGSGVYDHPRGDSAPAAPDPAGDRRDGVPTFAAVGARALSAASLGAPRNALGDPAVQAVPRGDFDLDTSPFGPSRTPDAGGRRRAGGGGPRRGRGGERRVGGLGRGLVLGGGAVRDGLQRVVGGGVRGRPAGVAVRRAVAAAVRRRGGIRIRAGTGIRREGIDVGIRAGGRGRARGARSAGGAMSGS